MRPGRSLAARALLVALLALTVLGVVAPLAGPAASAEEYRWQVNYQHVTLDIDQSGKVNMVYQVDADIVKGTWTEVWIPVTVGNMQISSVTDSTGQSHSYYVEDNQIKTQSYNLKPGDHVNLVINSTLPGFVYQSDAAGYDIVQFNPPWWDMAIQDTSVKYLLPGEVNTSEVFTGTGGPEYSGIGTENGRTIVYFNSSHLSNNEIYSTAVSFPDRYMAAGAVTKKNDNPGGIYVGGNSDSGAGSFWDACGCLPGAIVPGIILLIIIISAATGRKQYSSPTVSMDGVGVNKDLDPVEAAMLLRADPRRILTMIMFGVLKKGNVKLISTEPLRLEKVSAQGANYYEKLFLDAIQKDTLNEDRLLTCFKVLAQRVVDKTRPFCRKDTETYYKVKIDQAWQDLKAVDTPELKLMRYDTNMFWLLADEAFATKTNHYLRSPGWDTFTVPHSYWWYPYYFGQQPSPTQPTAGMGQPQASQPRATNQTTSSVETLANNVSNSVEAFSAGVVGGVESFLGVRNAANAPPAPAVHSSSSSCACVSCACACAHCACACACAGGGGGCT